MYLAHASTNYIIRYIETHHVDVSLSSACCRDGSCEVHEPQRQTSENVFLIYKAARHPSQGFVATVQRYEKVSKEQNKIGTIFIFSFEHKDSNLFAWLVQEVRRSQR